jgi:hypothetical protein
MLGKPKRFWHRGLTVVGMITILSAVVSALCFRFRRRASLELELVAFDIKSPCCGGSAQVGFGSSPQTGYSGFGSTGLGRGP